MLSGRTCDDDLQAIEKPWFYDILKFLESREYPEEASGKQKHALRVSSRSYTYHDGILYRRALNGILLRCLDRGDAEKVMKEIHAGVCGPHMSGHVLAKKIVQQGFYWDRMDRDCIDRVRKCHECQLLGIRYTCHKQSSTT